MIEAKIEKQPAVIFVLKEKHEVAVEKLNQLQKKRRELKARELLKTLESSDRSLGEVLAFMAVKSKNGGRELKTIGR